MARSASLNLLKTIVRANLDTGISSGLRSGFTLEAAQASPYLSLRPVCSLLHCRDFGNHQSASEGSLRRHVSSGYMVSDATDLMWRSELCSSEDAGSLSR